MQTCPVVQGDPKKIQRVRPCLLMDMLNQFMAMLVAMKPASHS